jgi:ABC-type transporter Mla maintaining outer membrane lipid asymmetry ATPase subunit MlaF
VKCLIGLLAPEAGSILIHDTDLEKMDMVGLTGDEMKLPGEISGGMRKRAGLARGLVLDPEIMLFDDPDSGLDPVRTATSIWPCSVPGNSC